MSEQIQIVPPPEQTQVQVDVPLEFEDKPQLQDNITAIDALLEKKQRKNPPACCGRLPCKGDKGSPHCFTCTKCLDCITGAGCGHAPASHDPRGFQIPNDEEDE